MVEKFPTIGVLGKLPQNLTGDFFDSHCSFIVTDKVQKHAAGHVLYFDIRKAKILSMISDDQMS